MTIRYKNLYEFSQAVIKCNTTAENMMCERCPFFDNCKIDEPQNRAIMSAEFEPETKCEDTKNET